MRYFIVVFLQHDIIYKYRNCSMAFRFPHVYCQLLAELHICAPQRSLIIILYIIYFLQTPTQQQWFCGYYSTTLARQLFDELKTILVVLLKKKKITNGQQCIIKYILGSSYIYNIYLYLPPRADGPVVFGLPRHYRCC